MDKNIIKTHLTILAEEKKANGLGETEKIQKQSGATNKAAMKDVEKELKDYDDASKTEKENSESVKKYENSKEDQELHDVGENQAGSIINLESENPPDETWEEKQRQAITGKDSTQGNAAYDKDGNPLGNVITADQAGFTGPEANQKIYDDNKKFKKKKDKSMKSAGMGDVQVGQQQFNENKKEKMKRLVFNNEFKGVENALKMIPEAYKVDNKEFHMTDGNEKYEIRWEGNLNEGRAVILKASDKNLMTEDMDKMKHLMGYKSEETLGLVHGAARIDEDASFADVLNKTKKLLSESEEGENETLND